MGGLKEEAEGMRFEVAEFKERLAEMREVYERFLENGNQEPELSRLGHDPWANYSLEELRRHECAAPSEWPRARARRARAAALQ